MKRTLLALSFPLLLAACGGNTPTPPAQDAPPVTQISGVVVSGSGTGTVSLKGSGRTLAEAPVDASGAFTLTLPEASALSGELKTVTEALTAAGCGGALTSSVASAKGYGVAALQVSRTGLNDAVYAANVGAQYFPPKGKFSATLWLYTDQATRLSGTLNCAELVNNAATLSISLDVTTRAGWNVLSVYGESGLPNLTAVSGSATLAADSQTVWRSSADLRAQLPF